VKIINVVFSGDFYHEYWSVVEKDGQLFVARCESTTEETATREAIRDVKQPYVLKAIARVGHTAYNQVKQPNFTYAVASKILEVAALELNIKYAEDTQPHPEGKWVGEEFEKENNHIAKQEAYLENAVEEGQLPGAMPADL